MATLAARAARKYRDLAKRGLAPDLALRRVASDVHAVTSWKEADRRADGTVVMYSVDYPIRASVGLLFPDDSALIFREDQVWVSRRASSSKDNTVYQYIDDLIPIVPIGRNSSVPHAPRYLFTESEQRLVVHATQILDSVLLNEWRMKLPVWMRWFSSDRLLVKNLIDAGGDANDVCSLLLGMLSNGRLTLLEGASESDDGTSVTIRHQSVP